MRSRRERTETRRRSASIRKPARIGKHDYPGWLLVYHDLDGLLVVDDLGRLLICDVLGRRRVVGLNYRRFGIGRRGCNDLLIILIVIL